MKKLLIFAFIFVLMGCSVHKYAPYYFVSVYESRYPLHGLHHYIVINHDPNIMTICYPVTQRNVIGSWDCVNDTLSFVPYLSVDRYNDNILTIRDFSKIEPNVMFAQKKYLVKRDSIIQVSNYVPTFDSIEQKVHNVYYLVKYKKVRYNIAGARE